MTYRSCVNAPHVVAVDRPMQATSSKLPPSAAERPTSAAAASNGRMEWRTTFAKVSSVHRNAPDHEAKKIKPRRTGVLLSGLRERHHFFFAFAFFRLGAFFADFFFMVFFEAFFEDFLAAFFPAFFVFLAEAFFAGIADLAAFFARFAGRLATFLVVSAAPDTTSVTCSTIGWSSMSPSSFPALSG
jgi:uncharacterized membrane protein YjjP (DUF1212 family)